MIGNASAATYYVTNDALGGGDGSWGSPWSLVEGFSSASANDTVKIQGGTYTDMHPVVGNSGSSGNLIVFESDNGTVILDGVDDTGNGVTSSKNYIHIKNLEIINFDDGISFSNSDYFNVSGCNITLCGGNGIYINDGGVDSVITECTINSNAEHGISLNFAFFSTFDLKNNYVDDYDTTYYDYSFYLASGVTVHNDVLEYDRYYFETGTDTIVFTGAVDFNVSTNTETVFSYENYEEVILDIEVYSGSIISTDIGVDTNGVNYLLKSPSGSIIETQTSDGSGDITFATDLGTGNYTFGHSNFTSYWDTTKISDASTNNDQIKLPLESDGTYDFVVYWGDGNNDTITVWNQANVTHTYASTGIYQIVIDGTIDGFRFGDTGDEYKIINVTNWGALNLGNNGGYFYGCHNFNFDKIDGLDISGTTNMSYAFKDCLIFDGNISMSYWDVSGVTTMKEMFMGTSFNQPINNWDVSSVTNMYSTFRATPFNQNINDWDVSSVTNMAEMFYAAYFNQPLDQWDMSSVTNMRGMFMYAFDFNQNITGWDASSATTMKEMFFRANYFDQDISVWNVSSVTDMSWTFYSADVFDQDLSAWDVSSVTTMDRMFDDMTLSTANYDAMIIGWSELPSLQNNVVFHAGNSKYSHGAPASARNDTLIGVYSWSITDGGVIFDLIEISNPNPSSDFSLDVDEAQMLSATLDRNATSVWYVDEIEIQTDHNTTTPDYYFTSSTSGVFNVTFVSTDPIYGSSESFTWNITVIDESVGSGSVYSRPSGTGSVITETTEEQVPDFWDEYEIIGEDIEEVFTTEIPDEKLWWIVIIFILLLLVSYYYEN